MMKGKNLTDITYFILKVRLSSIVNMQLVYEGLL